MAPYNNGPLKSIPGSSMDASQTDPDDELVALLNEACLVACGNLEQNAEKVLARNQEECYTQITYYSQVLQNVQSDTHELRKDKNSAARMTARAQTIQVYRVCLAKYFQILDHLFKHLEPLLGEMNERTSIITMRGLSSSSPHANIQMRETSLLQGESSLPWNPLIPFHFHIHH